MKINRASAARAREMARAAVGDGEVGDRASRSSGTEAAHHAFRPRIRRQSTGLARAMAASTAMFSATVRWEER